MWSEPTALREQAAMGRSSAGSEVVMLDDRVMDVASRSQPAVNNLSVTKSSRVHIGPKFVSVTQNVETTEVVKGRILGLELVSPQNTKRLRCSIAVFVCWAFVVASALTFFIFYFALAKQVARLDLDLPLHSYLWNLAKSTTKAERLSCATAIVVLVVCIFLIVYFTVIAKKNARTSDVAPHEWFITRDEWLAPKFNTTERTTAFEPLRLVIIAHTVSPECTLFADCAAELRNIHNYYIKNYRYDLPYNFLIGNDGRVYEGRGWNVVGAHTLGYNRCSMGIAFIGDYRIGSTYFSKVSELQLKRAMMLFAEGVKLKKLHPQFEVLGAKDLQSTYSPGTNLYNAIRAWSNYAFNNVYKDRTCEQIHASFEQEDRTKETGAETISPTSVNPETIAVESASIERVLAPPAPAPTQKERLAASKDLAPHEWFITRDQWLAPEFNTSDKTTAYGPLRLVVITHTVSPECSQFVACAAQLRNIQSYYNNTYHTDLPYNFVIGNDERVYEGRGWDVVGALTFGYNRCSMGLAFIGDYRPEINEASTVSEGQLLRATKLFEEGVRLGHLHADFKVVGMKDLHASISPGENLYNAIKQWPFYAHDNIFKNRTCDQIYAMSTNGNFTNATQVIQNVD